MSFCAGLKAAIAFTSSITSPSKREARAVVVPTKAETG
jgi:hypothetical protein